MERPSKFDRAIQDKLAGLEAEPSARVWAQVRDGIGTVPLSPVQGKPFAWYRAAAAVALLVLAAGGAYYFLGGNRAESVGANTFGSHDKRNWPSHIVKDSETTDTAGPTKQLKSVQPQRFDQMYTVQPQQLIQQPKLEVPAQVEQKEQIIVKQEAPKLEAPIQEVPQVPVPQVEVYASNSNPAAGTKRSYRMPTADDLSLANLRKKTKGVLPSLAGTVDEKLGIPTEYSRETTTDGEKTAFSLDLGFIKFRKVHSTKQLYASNE